MRCLTLGVAVDQHHRFAIKQIARVTRGVARLPWRLGTVASVRGASNQIQASETLELTKGKIGYKQTLSAHPWNVRS